MKPSSSRVAACYFEFQGDASVADTDALTENIATFAQVQLGMAGFDTPSDIDDLTIPFVKAIATLPHAKRVAYKYLAR